MKALLMLLCLATTASAQTIGLGVSLDGTINADWEEIARCASKPYMAPNDDDPRSHRMVESHFQRASFCRTALAARHAGWIAAGGIAADDPFQPQPMSRKDDFKEKLICDYSKLDKNGAGFVTCNDD